MRHLYPLAAAFLLLCSMPCKGHAQQYPLLDKLAARVVEKYQTSSCGQIAEERGQHPNGRKAAEVERVVQVLHDDPQMRNEFIARVAAPIANKLFECGFIP